MRFDINYRRQSVHRLSLSHQQSPNSDSKDVPVEQNPLHCVYFENNLVRDRSVYFCVNSGAHFGIKATKIPIRSTNALEPDEFESSLSLGRGTHQIDILMI